MRKRITENGNAFNPVMCAESITCKLAADAETRATFATKLP